MREGRKRRRSEHRGKKFGFQTCCLKGFGTCKWKCQRSICVRGSSGERPGLEIEIIGLGEIMQEKQ